jgi:hypothetical protein
MIFRDDPKSHEGIIPAEDVFLSVLHQAYKRNKASFAFLTDHI